MKDAWPIVLAVSSILALPLAFASIVVASPATGSWSAVLQHTGFWSFYGKAWLWFFVCGSLASILSLAFIHRRDVKRKGD